jgi:hypothetical protein
MGTRRLMPRSKPAATPAAGFDLPRTRRLGNRPRQRDFNDLSIRQQSFGLLRSLGPAGLDERVPTGGARSPPPLRLARSSSVAVMSETIFCAKCLGARTEAPIGLRKNCYLEKAPRQLASGPAGLIQGRGPGRGNRRGRPPTRSLQLTTVSPRCAVGAEPQEH